MSEYTPGPWWMRWLASGGYSIEAPQGDDRRTRVVRGSGGVARQADAALISAAPDLLEACLAFLTADANDSDARLAAFDLAENAASKALDRPWALATGHIVLLAPRQQP